MAATRVRLGGGGVGAPSLEVFSRWRINDGAARCCFCHSCLDNLSAPFLKILCPGHLRSGHQVRSNDPNSNKFYNCVTATVVEIKIWNFQDLIYYQVPTTCISRILNIGDLRSGQFRDLPIMSRWGKSQVPQILTRSVQIVEEHVQSGYCWWYRCKFANVTPRKVIWGHIMTSRGQSRSMDVFACNFWLDWDRDTGGVNCGKKLKSTSKFDLRSRSKVDLGSSCCTSFDAPWRGEPFGTCPMSLSQSNQKLPAKTSIDLVTSLYDLKWPFWGSHLQSCTDIINSSLIEHVSERFEQIW